MQINKAVALVSGANRGIGKALVGALTEAGAGKIYACARDTSTLKFTSGNSEIVPLQLDICDHKSLRSLPEKAGDINLLINNAGILDFGDILEVPLDHIKRNFDTNFTGTLALCRSLIPVIETNGGGAIINMLSLLSLASMPGIAAYNASKAAAWSMTLSLRASLSNRNIAVHGIFPGAVDTDMLDGIEIPKTLPADVARAIVNGINNNQEDIFPDPMSIEVYANWCKDHKAIERKFAQM